MPAPAAKPTRFAPHLNMPVRGFFPTLAPLIALSVFALILSLTIPIYNDAAVHNPTQDLYLLVWSYDTIGFGPCCGRSGHNLEKGMNQARFDLSLTASDLFGWELGTLNGPYGPMRPDLQDHLLNQGDYWELIGLSWVLLPFAFVIAYRKKAIFIALWVGVSYGLVYFAMHWQNGIQMQNPTFSYIWLGTALAWLYLPIVFWRDQQRAWTWLLWCIPVGLVVMQMAYWIGSQRYSTRYFFEGLTAISIISALPIAWLARRLKAVSAYLGWWWKTISENVKTLSTPACITLVCALVLAVVFYFLPWVNGLGTSSTGVKLLYEVSITPEISSILWLIPIAAVVGIVGGVWGVLDLSDRKTPKIVGAAAGIIALAYYGAAVASVLKSQIGFSPFGFGFWIGLVLSVGLILQSLIPASGVIRLPAAVIHAGNSRWVIYPLFALALVYSLYFYSTPRIDVLTGYNYIDGSQIAGVQARRTGNQPVLVIVNGANVAWRAFAALAAETSPYLNSDIVAAWNYEGVDGDVKDEILKKFPDRQVIEMQGSGNYAWFSDQQPPPGVTSTG